MLCLGDVKHELCWGGEMGEKPAWPVREYSKGDGEGGGQHIQSRVEAGEEWIDTVHKRRENREVKSVKGGGLADPHRALPVRSSATLYIGKQRFYKKIFLLHYRYLRI